MKTAFRWLPNLAIALSVTVLSFAQTAQDPKIVDINFASQADLQKLPGITPEIAQKILAKRPFKKIADLKAVGLSDSAIQAIQQRIKFGQKPNETPAQRPAGPISQGADSQELILRAKANSAERKAAALLQLCSGTWDQANPSVVSADSAAAVCLPKTWFAPDGTLNSAGQTKLNGITDRRKWGKDIAVISAETASPFDKSEMGLKFRQSVVTYLGEKGYQVSYHFTSNPFKGAHISAPYNLDSLDKMSWSDNQSLILIIPPSASEVNSQAQPAGEPQ